MRREGAAEPDAPAGDPAIERGGVAGGEFPDAAAFVLAGGEADGAGGSRLRREGADAGECHHGEAAAADAGTGEMQRGFGGAEEHHQGGADGGRAPLAAAQAGSSCGGAAVHEGV